MTHTCVAAVSNRRLFWDLTNCAFDKKAVNVNPAITFSSTMLENAMEELVGDGHLNY